MPIERRRILYRGRVQGVGFRYTAQHLAAEFAVSGFVRNLDDGGVEVVAEGEREDLASFQAAIAREMGDKIRDVHAEPEPTGAPPLVGFVIRP